jgi:alpha-ribazole phosphatase
VKSRALHLLRHGAPEAAGRLIGHTDSLPTQLGRAACRKRAQGLRVAQVVSSDLSRALWPARDVAADLGVPLVVDPRWRELDFGAWEECDPANMSEALLHFWADPDASPPPQGESWSQICARVAAALDELEQDALVVTHAGAMRAALSVLLGFDHAQVWAFHLRYGALLSLRIWSDGAQITGLSA